VRVLDQVVLGLRLVGVAGEPAVLAEQVEPVLPPGHDLVHVRLVPGIEQDAVFRGVEHPVQGQGDLDDAEVGPEVAAGAGHLGDQEVTDLGRQQGQLVRFEPLQVLRAGHAGEQGVLAIGTGKSAHERSLYPGPSRSQRPCAHAHEPFTKPPVS
jgi:hypothetical protein